MAHGSSQGGGVLSLRQVRGGVGYVFATLAPAGQDGTGPAFRVLVAALNTLVAGSKRTDDVAVAQLLSALDCLHDASTVVLQLPTLEHAPASNAPGGACKQQRQGHALASLESALAILQVPAERVVRKSQRCVKHAMQALAAAHVREVEHDPKWHSRGATRLQLAAALLQDAACLTAAPGVTDAFNAMHAADRVVMADCFFMALHELHIATKNQSEALATTTSTAAAAALLMPARARQQQKQKRRQRLAAGKPKAADQVGAANAAVAAFMRTVSFGNPQAQLRSFNSAPAPAGSATSAAAPGGSSAGAAAKAAAAPALPPPPATAAGAAASGRAADAALPPAAAAQGTSSSVRTLLRQRAPAHHKQLAGPHAKRARVDGAPCSQLHAQ